MNRRLIVSSIVIAMMLAVAPQARATHFDGVAQTGSFNPLFSATIGETRASRPGDINFHLTQADHEDPPVITTLKAPGDWQFTFDFLRRGQKSNGSFAGSCNDTINNRNNSPDRTGTPGGPTDYSKRTDAFIARAEKIGSAFLAAHATGVSSRPPAPNQPITFRGDLAFVSYDSVTKTAKLCLLLKLITNTSDPDYSPSNENARTFADPVPGSGSDEVESVTELTADFQFINVGGTWQTVIDLTDLVKSQELQALDVSIVDFKANFFGNTVGNWNTEGSIPFARDPGTSGTKTFTGIFQTCPQNDPSYLNCKSNKGDGSSATVGGTVTRNVAVSITPAPGITIPLNNAACTDSVDINGTADPGTLVRVLETTGGPEVTLADVTANASGAWALRRPFSPGLHTILARMISPSGPDSLPVTFNVSVAPPAITAPADGTLVEPGTSTVSGTAPVGTRTVSIYQGSTLVGSGPADDLGNWSADVTLAPHQSASLAARALNLCGEGALSAARTLNVNTTQPAFATPLAGAFLNTPTPTITGTADAGATVTLDEGGTIASATAGPGGTWSTPTAALGEGVHTVTATATYGAFTSLPSASLSFTIDLSPPSAPTIASPADGSTLEPTVTFSGTSEPLSRVVVFDGAGTIGQATATAGGAWSLPTVLDVGEHTVAARAIDRAGNTGPDSASITLTIIDPLKILSPVENGTYPAKVPFDVVTSPAAVELIVFDDGVEIARKPVANRRYTGQITLTGGTHSITVQTRAANNSLSNTTAARTFTVDASPPTVSVNSLAGSGVNLVNPQLSGSASDAGAFDSGVARIVITYRGRVGGVFMETASCNGCTGASVLWTASPSSVINKAGVYDAFITAFDAVGNASATAKTTFVIA